MKYRTGTELKSILRKPINEKPDNYVIISKNVDFIAVSVYRNHSPEIIDLESVENDYKLKEKLNTHSSFEKSKTNIPVLIVKNYSELETWKKTLVLDYLMNTTGIKFILHSLGTVGIPKSFLNKYISDIYTLV